MSKSLILVIVIITLMAVGYWYYQSTTTSEGSKECILDDDCVVFGKTGDCNCGCYNKNNLPSGTGGECFCAAPNSCKCVSGECAGVIAELEDEVIESWETFQNEKHRYEIKYPKDWKVLVAKGQGFADITKENCSLSIYEILEGQLEETTEGKEDLINLGCSSEWIIMNEIIFEKVMCPEELLTTERVLAEYYFRKGGINYRIIPGDNSAFWRDLGEPIPSSFIKCEEYFEQILSTFRFLD